MSTKLLTPKEAAKILEISPQQLYRLINLGKLPAVNIGSRTRGIYRINPSQLDEFMRGTSQAPEAAAPASKRRRIPKNIKQYV
jgi:excisionase family DNA binding protein